MKQVLGFRHRLFFLLLLLPLAGVSQSYVDFADSVQAWVDARVDAANAGKSERVVMPVAVRSLGWGCECPDAYLGESPGVHEGPWIWVVSKRRFPEVDRLGHSLIVTGRFTGDMQQLDLRNDDGEPEEWLYVMPVFRAEKWKPNKNVGEAAAPKVIGN
ncbi:MAG: hypothetical protein U0176_12555 [Bacteroidia bacterium]